MFRQKLRGLFEKTPVIHYIKQVDTVVIGEIIIDVKNILLRNYACDGAHCLSTKALPNTLDDYGLTFYNEVAAYGDCCRGPIVFVSQDERQQITDHLEGIIPHMSQEGQFIVKDALRQKGSDHKHETFAESARVARGSEGEQELDFAKLHTIWGDQCIFRTLHHDGVRGYVRCAIHAYAVQSGVSYLDVKPADCWFWPLALVPLYTGKFFLTVHTEETRHFTEESESYVKKRCLTEPIPGSPYIYQSFQNELIHVFGQEWFDALTACACQYHNQTAGGRSEDRIGIQQYSPHDAQG
ncbi:MAG: hypothetical protein O7G88_19455 [bacterium]|nr:hypothetical protein [bacterium]